MNRGIHFFVDSVTRKGIIIGGVSKYLYPLLCLIFLSLSSYSQRTCVSPAHVVNAGVLEEAESSVSYDSVIIIPVVVHVVYNSNDQNISDEQVRSQIDVLNRDYRLKNADAAFIPASFKNVAGDARIEFRLATLDPSGKPTNGIRRVYSQVTGFGVDDQIKFTATGGDDAWDRDEYLNIWTGNLVGGAMGYASLPGCAPVIDGVVIRHAVFGTTPNVAAPFNKGRTAVHEIGHWLGLRHIWGDASCGDDKIDDTPPQQGPTRGCPSGTLSSCSGIATGIMYMNFMDFTNDECTNMFTQGQVVRMRSLFNKGGARESLLFSRKADGATSEFIAGQTSEIQSITVFPNPSSDFITVRITEPVAANDVVKVFSYAGQLVNTTKIAGNTVRIDVRNLRAGIYFVSAGKNSRTKFIRP